MKLLQRLQTLPREARDTLFLLLVIAWIILPLTNPLPVWCSAMAALMLLWRGQIAVQGRSLPSRWWLLLLLVLAATATYASHRTLMGRDAGVTSIVVLLSLKTLEMRARRDAFVVFFLGFFTLLSNFFFSQSLLTAVAMVLGLLGLLTALVNHHMPVGRPPLRQAARMAGGMALLGAPIMVVLFVLFPRIAPLWGLPGDATAGRSGLSGNMEVGTIASLALDSSIAMRIRFEGAMPPQRDLYFRGPVLTQFDGRRWRPSVGGYAPSTPQASNLQTSGTPVRYEVTLEASRNRWLPLLDVTSEKPTIPGYRPYMGAGLDWGTERPINELLRFNVQSYTRFSHGPLQMQPSLQEALYLPPGSNPRTVQLAREIRSDPRYAKADATALVPVLMDRLRAGGYRYTLDPGVYGDNTADEFWFDRKEGFCEHIASSFVVLMRALQVPARVVTGYQGGELNTVDGYWTVRQSDAHAWAEVWVAGQGWVRVDPTTAVAPARIGELQRLLPQPGVIGQALQTISPRFQISLRALWEASNNRWNQWVLSYSQTQQLDLLRKLGFEAPSWTDLSTVLLGLVVAVSLVGAAWAQWERMRQDPWLRLLHGASRKLQRAGLKVALDTPPRTLAMALGSSAEQQHLRDWLLRLEAWRYAPSGTSAQNKRSGLGTLQREFRQLRWPQQLPPTTLPT